MAEQTDFGFTDPLPTERPTLAPAPTTPYVAPRLQPEPLTLFDLMRMYSEQREADKQARLWLREFLGIELSEEAI